MYFDNVNASSVTITYGTCFSSVLFGRGGALGKWSLLFNNFVWNFAFLVTPFSDTLLFIPTWSWEIHNWRSLMPASQCSNFNSNWPSYWRCNIEILTCLPSALLQSNVRNYIISVYNCKKSLSIWNHSCSEIGNWNN